MTKTIAFSITIPGQWGSKSGEQTIDELNKLLELRSQEGIELHVKEVKERENRPKIGDNENELSDLILKKNEIFEELKKAKYNDLDDLVFRFQLTYDEIIDLLDLKYNATKRTGYSLNPGIYEITDIYETLEHILPDNVKVSITIDDIRIKSILNFNKTLIFTKKFSFYRILGFTQSHSYL